MGERPKHVQPKRTDEAKEEGRNYHEPGVGDNPKSNLDPQKYRFLPGLQGVENAAFQKQESSPQKAEAMEVYFADVTSCCNSSNFQENVSPCTVTEDEDCLAHRMGNRQM